MKKRINKNPAVMVLIAILVIATCLMFSGCSNSDNEEENNAAAVNSESTYDPWEYFKSINLVGKSAAEVTDTLGDLEVITTDGGGTWYRSASGIIVAFPYSKDAYGDPIGTTYLDDENIICSVMAGTEEQLFGMDCDITIEEIEELLGVEIGEDLSGMDEYGAYFELDGTPYYMALNSAGEVYEGHSYVFSIYDQQ